MVSAKSEINKAVNSYNKIAFDFFDEKLFEEYKLDEFNIKYPNKKYYRRYVSRILEIKQKIKVNYDESESEVKMLLNYLDRILLKIPEQK